MIIPHVAGVVGSHDGVIGVGLKLAVHDLVSVWRVLAAEVSVGVDVEGAAKHAPVELQSLAGVAVEVEVRIQPRRHRLLLPPRDRRDSRARLPDPPIVSTRSAANPRRRATGQPPPHTGIEPNAPNRFSARTKPPGVPCDAPDGSMLKAASNLETC